jgi:deoxycytidylate deaminase
MQDDLFQNNIINPWATIIGFTGSFGSGCTMIAKYLETKRNYKRFALSEVIKQEAQKRNLGNNLTTQELQKLGNELRQKNGNDYLVQETFKLINSQKVKDQIIIDSIRNKGEVDALRKYVNFYLLGVHAPQEVRKKRTRDKYKNRENEFSEDDKRDSEELFEYGQQVRLCMYLADILITNDIDFHPNSKFESNFYRDRVNYYLDLIENPGSKYPTPNETLMTLAYAQSIRSSCQKRKVGALITTEDNQVIATGFNEVPKNAFSCRDKYGMCFRDKIRLEFIQKMTFCPQCGKKIKIDYECPKCKKHIENFELKCTNEECRIDLDIPVICPDNGCGFDIRAEFNMKELGRCRSLHAEETAIISFPKAGGGVSLKGGKVYTTTFPCNLCANKIVNTGISTVVYVEPYPDFNSHQILEDNKVDVEQFQGVKSRAYFKLFSNL